jgi:peptidoglycan hydrolase-like protein with peptidoglycan-binding domain
VSREKGRRRTILIASVIAVALTAVFGGGWFAAQTFVSPAQRAASAAPPAASEITSVVQRGNLSHTVTAEATIEQQRHDIVPLAAGDGVVTAVTAAPGDQLVAGAVAAEVNGRPVLVLPGEFRAYRDLTPGDSGADVAQLQRGLTAAGFWVPETGYFGELTTEAVNEMYSAVNYDASEIGRSPSSGTAAGTADVAGAPVAPVVAAAPTLVVPQNELLVLPVLPATVESVPAVGTEQSAEPKLAVWSGTPVARATVPSGIAALFAVDTAGTVTVDAISLPVRVTAVLLGAEGEDSFVTVESTDPASPTPVEWLGKVGVISADLQTIAQDALIVPTSAIVDQGRKATVFVQTKYGSFLQIAVRELGALDGRSAVEPVDPDSLAEGDLVRVG